MLIDAPWGAYAQHALAMLWAAAVPLVTSSRTAPGQLLFSTLPMLASFSLCAFSLYHQMQQVQMAVPCVFHNQNHNKPDNHVSKVPYSRIP